MTTDVYAELADQLFCRRYAHTANAIRMHSPIRQGDRSEIFDFGAGDGSFAEVLTRGTDAVVDAIEPDAWARTMLGHRPFVRTILGNSLDGDFGSRKKYDLVVASHSLYFIDPLRWANTVEHLASKLLPGGVLSIVMASSTGKIFSDPVFDFMKDAARLLGGDEYKLFGRKLFMEDFTPVLDGRGFGFTLFPVNWTLWSPELQAAGLRRRLPLARKLLCFVNRLDERRVHAWFPHELSQAAEHIARSPKFAMLDVVCSIRPRGRDE